MMWTLVLGYAALVVIYWGPKIIMDILEWSSQDIVDEVEQEYWQGRLTEHPTRRNVWIRTNSSDG